MKKIRKLHEVHEKYIPNNKKETFKIKSTDCMNAPVDNWPITDIRLVYTLSVNY